MSIRLSTIGTDFEVGAKHTASGRMATASYLSRNHPAVFGSTDGGRLHPDGVALELSTYVAGSLQDFRFLINEGKKAIERKLKGIGFEPVYEPEIAYEAELLDDPLDWEVGCNPYQNVYTGGLTIPQPYGDPSRHFSGHIHLGLVDETEQRFQLSLEEWSPVVKAIEIGINSVLWNVDKSTTRRKGYGAAGNVRIKNYGIEIRSPSVAWVGKPTVWGGMYKKIQWGLNNYKKVDKMIDAATWQYVHNERVDKEARSIFRALSLIKD